MKEPATYRYRCNFCGEEISDSMKGSTYWFDEDLGRWRTRAYESFEDHDIHLHNRCQLAIVWLYPGGKWNPTGRNDEGERDCCNCGYSGKGNPECATCKQKDINGNLYYQNWQAKKD
jgi:hypothetical protein